MTGSTEAARLTFAEHRVSRGDFLGFGASDKPEDATYSFPQQVGDQLL